MEKLNIIKTRDLDLCVSCELCSATCPEGAITMENKFGQFLPKVYDEKCTSCGLCLELCPGIDIDPSEFGSKKISNNIFDGPCLEGYTAYSNNFEIRTNSTSGGLVTNLIIELIKNKEFDAAFILDFNKFDGKPARLKAANNISEILSAAKSKYIPASVYNIIKTLKKADNKQYIIVGTPCQIYGIKKFIRKNNLSGENLLFLGLFCEKTLNFNIIRYFEDTYGKPNEKLIKFEFRTKEKYGWPGNSKVYFDSGRELIVDRSVRIKLKKYFQLNRCLFCLDKLNRYSDISFGDCYIKEKSSFYGQSSVIIRTNKGKEIFDKYSYLFSIEKVDVDEIRESQELISKKDNLEYAKIFIKENNMYPDIYFNYEKNEEITKKLLKLQQYIKWGRNYNIKIIRFSLFLSNIINKLKFIGRDSIKYIGERIIAGISFMEGFFIYMWGRKRPVSRKMTTRNVIIVGGELVNKGAQAMTFTVVDQVKRRYQNKNIYLCSLPDFNRKEDEKKMYKFNILPWNLIIKIRLLNPFLNKLLRIIDKYKHVEDNIRGAITNANFFIDISGYALSSQWGLVPSINYLSNIIIAKKNSIPYYILPQSIGPFDYPLIHKIILFPLMKLYLRYPNEVFCREKEGIICVHKFRGKNVEKSYDIVLQNEEYDLFNIYNRGVHFKNIKIEPHSVGIIPNVKVIEQGKPYKIYSIYNSLINRLIDAKKPVYILRHSFEDLEVCERIKSFFPNNENVKLISDDLNAIELTNIIKQFDFVIASRYHSVIHSYKKGVPALVIGWATKYYELLEDFNQLDYFFDGRSDISITEINNKLDKMIRNCKYERDKIIDTRTIINKENVFDKIFASTNNWEG